VDCSTRAPLSRDDRAATDGRRGTTKLTGTARTAIAVQTHNAHWNPPVSASALDRPEATRVPVWLAATVDVTATPSAPPSC